MLGLWLQAFNQGDAALKEFMAKHEPDRPVDRAMQVRDQSGGFDLVSVVSSEPTRVAFEVKERDSGFSGTGRIEVREGDPAIISKFSLRITPDARAASGPAIKLDAAERARVIDGAIAALEEYYVYPDKAKAMAEAVRGRQTRGEYNAVEDGEAFADLLTEHLRDVSHDKHLRVRFTPGGPPKPDGSDADEAARYRREMERINCGFETAERLSGNVGYLKFNMFADPEVCGATATAALNFLGNVDAIIFDIRQNGGGDPAMVALISSYLFDEPTHLNDLYDRKEDRTTQYWTLPYVAGKKLAGKPVYVLTSARTFSGAEEFSYNLKNLKRATIVGEVTGGGAHPVATHAINDHFSIGVPFARAINPISKTNWEGTGVEPDVKAPEGEALAVAKKLAAATLAKRRNAPHGTPDGAAKSARL